MVTKKIKKIIKKTKKKNPVWRPSKFKVELIQKLKDYFCIESNEFKDIVTTGKNKYKRTEHKEFASNLPTIQWFCADNWISRQIFHNWLGEARSWVKIKKKGWWSYIRKDSNKVKFLDTYTHVKEFQERIWIENSLKWLYNPQFAIFMWKNVFWWKDKTEVDNNHSWTLTIVDSLKLNRKKQRNEDPEE